MKFEEFECVLKDEKLLVHASLTAGIGELRPGANGMVFATDNISCAVLCALLKLKTERNPVIMQSYAIGGKTFHICSVDREFREVMESLRLHFYICRRDDFQRFQKIDSGLSRMTFQWIPNVGHEWICRDVVTPVDSWGIFLRELVNYTEHSAHEIKPKILLRWLMRHCRKNPNPRSDFQGSGQERH